jgi:hypothetical protein
MPGRSPSPTVGTPKVERGVLGRVANACGSLAGAAFASCRRTRGNPNGNRNNGNRGNGNTRSNKSRANSPRRVPLRDPIPYMHNNETSYRAAINKMIAQIKTINHKFILLPAHYKGFNNDLRDHGKLIVGADDVIDMKSNDHIFIQRRTPLDPLHR